MRKSYKKKGNGEGSIYLRPDGRWCASIQVGTDINGKVIRKSFYGKQRKEVAQKLDNYKFHINTGEKEPVSITLDEYI